MKKKEEEEKAQFGIVNFERRRRPRFSVDLPIEYWRMDSTTKSRGRMGNASEGGLMFYLPEKLEIGQKVRARVFFTSEPGVEAIEALAEVVWIDMHFGEEGDYRTGVKFLDISAEDFIKLKNFLDGLSNLQAPSKSSLKFVT